MNFLVQIVNSFLMSWAPAYSGLLDVNLGSIEYDANSIPITWHILQKHMYVTKSNFKANTCKRPSATKFRSFSNCSIQTRQHCSDEPEA